MSSKYIIITSRLCHIYGHNYEVTNCYYVSNNVYPVHVLCLHVDLVTAVPRYDGNTYAGRVNVYTPPAYNTIVTSVDAQGSQVHTCVCLCCTVACSCWEIQNLCMCVHVHVCMHICVFSGIIMSPLMSIAFAILILQGMYPGM